MSAKATQDETKYKPKNTTLDGKKRIPDAIPSPSPAGKLRPYCEDGVLSVSVSKLPDGRNY